MKKPLRTMECYRSQAKEKKWLNYQNGMWGVGLDYYRERIRGMNPTKGLLLDLGCGPGQWSAAAVEEGFIVIGCDNQLSGKVLEIRRSFSFTLVQGSAEHLPFRDNTFQVVLCELVLPYVHIERCIEEITRVMKPMGVFHGICHGPGYYLMQAMREAKRREGKGLRRRLIVLAYTIIHRIFHFKKYFYETFQSSSDIENAFVNSGLSIVSIKPGGHPILRQKRFLGCTTFFEFCAKKILR